jgi:hypothetical protein
MKALEVVHRHEWPRLYLAGLVAIYPVLVEAPRGLVNCPGVSELLKEKAQGSCPRKQLRWEWAHVINPKGIRVSGDKHGCYYFEPLEDNAPDARE